MLLSKKHKVMVAVAVGGLLILAGVLFQAKQHGKLTGKADENEMKDPEVKDIDTFKLITVLTPIAGGGFGTKTLFENFSVNFAVCNSWDKAYDADEYEVGRDFKGFSDTPLGTTQPSEPKPIPGAVNYADDSQSYTEGEQESYRYNTGNLADSEPNADGSYFRQWGITAPQTYNFTTYTWKIQNHFPLDANNNRIGTDSYPFESDMSNITSKAQSNEFDEASVICKKKVPPAKCDSPKSSWMDRIITVAHARTCVAPTD